MDETTTDAAVQEPQALDAQPVEQPAEAVTTDSEPQVEDPSVNEPVETDNSDDDLMDYWSKKGIDITTPEGQRQAAQSYREAEKAMHAKGQRASELEQQLNQQPLAEQTQDPAVQEALARASRVETALEVERWKANNGITPDQDKALGKYLTENPQKAWLVKNGHLNLDDVYAMSGINKVDPDAIRKQGGQEALQGLANKQRTTAPEGSAVNQAPAAQLTKANVDSWWSGLGPEGRADPANRAKLDSILSA